MVMAIEAAGLTDVGLVRRHNEDSFYLDDRLGLFIVADGLGGHAAGEVASRIVVEEIADYIGQTAQTEAGALPNFDSRLSRNANRLKQAIFDSDAAIMENIARYPEHDTMGSTVVVCLVEGSKATIAHVGDSRAYMMGRDGIRQLTRDHSWVAEQIANGILTVEEAKRHPFRNVITQALGNGNDLVIDVLELELEASDAVLLCSDGLSGMIDDDGILSIFKQASNLQIAVRSLVCKAIENGGEDNVTVIILKGDLS
jgi:protein phosphatase